MNKFLIILTILIAAAGCRDSGNTTVEALKNLDSKYCTNHLELISPYSDFIDIDFKFYAKGENTLEKIFMKLGDDFCDFRVDLGVPFNIATLKFGASKSAIPLNVKVYKQCVQGWACSLHNYIEVLYNANHQILLEGEYVQKEELDSMIPKYYNDNQTLYDLVPRKTFISVQWDLSVEEDSLSSLFGAIIDGYLKSADLYSSKRYKTDICNLTKNQLDSLKMDFPFNLELPTYQLVVPPVPVQLSTINEKWGCSANDFLSLKNEKFSNQLFLKLDSIRSYQYPNNDQEVNISVDLTKEYLNKFLNDIDKDILSKTGRYEKEYHFNIAPDGHTDPKECMDKITVDFSFIDCSYRMVVWNTFLVEPNWCVESQVIYSFKIKNNSIIDFYRNEVG